MLLVGETIRYDTVLTEPVVNQFLVEKLAPQPRNILTNFLYTAHNQRSGFRYFGRGGIWLRLIK